MHEIRAHKIHEGRGTSIRRTDDSVDVTNMISAEANVTMTVKELEVLDFEMVLDRLKSLAKQFNEQSSKHVFETMSKATEETGQVLDKKGQPLTNEDFFKMVEMMQINFERNLEVGDFSIVTSPAMLPVFQRLDDEMKNSPELQKRWKELLDRKRNEFRDREANRSLVG